MRYAFSEVVFLEVPDEVSLLFFISGCPHRCAGCHSFALWPEETGHPLTQTVFTDWLDRYQGLITCVCFFGGEWWSEQLQELLDGARDRGLKTCLYTGLENVDPALKQRLDYLKTGSWRAQRGGLDQPGTNQRLIRVVTGELLNYRFQKKERVLCKDF